ncbi:hypothetical protein ig2599ANME_0251 [groundwater metagenome]
MDPSDKSEIIIAAVVFGVISISALIFIMLRIFR